MIPQLSQTESILYFYIKQNKWINQRSLIAYRGKDDRRTRKVLQLMESKGIIKSKYIKVKRQGFPYDKCYNINRS